MLWTFHILLKKNFCYSFYRLYLLKIGQFMTILTQTCFKSNNERVLTKMVQNPIQNWYSNVFCKYQSFIQPKTSLGQNCQKLANFQKTKSVNWVTNFFLHKIWNVHSIWLPHRFLISGPKVTPKGPPDAVGLPLAKKRDSFTPVGVSARNFFSRQSLCIYPHVQTCTFFLRPTYF